MKLKLAENSCMFKDYTLGKNICKDSISYRPHPAKSIFVRIDRADHVTEEATCPDII